MATAPFALPALEALHRAGPDIVAVYTQPPRPAGRGKRLRASVVAERAEFLGLDVRTPVSLRDGAASTAFRALDADVAVVAAYGLMLPRPILEAPRLGCINLHPSLLPRWRGATPVAHTILHGDRETGLTVFRMDEGLDTGAILCRHRLPVPHRATTDSLESCLAGLAADVLPGLLGRLEDHLAVAEPQNGRDATYARKFTRADGRVDWRRSADEIDRMVRGLNPRPGVHFGPDSAPVKILEAEAVAGEAAPGTLLDRSAVVACGRGALRLVKVRAAGRPTTDGAAWLRGQRLEPPARLA
ncbi:MAG: methionyl-tRNA formyltransferase [Alphaproteobacteria bacterium]|nr:methionyl-tRNA formyltransferase [Alphaproteobacteria bacterium]